MIEKLKVLVLGKLRTMQLVEADIQLIMRMFVNIRNKGNMESDERGSKRNYGSRTAHLVAYAILEKILVFDNIIVTVNYNIHAIADLQAFCDMKL